MKFIMEIDLIPAGEGDRVGFYHENLHISSRIVLNSVTSQMKSQVAAS